MVLPEDFKGRRRSEKSAKRRGKKQERDQAKGSKIHNRKRGRKNANQSGS
jgi:hypothetical protein